MMSGNHGFELVRLTTGVHSLRWRGNGETFHPVVGPAREAAELHVGGTKLVQRAIARPPGRDLVIWDVGLGAAANALGAIEALAVYAREETVTLLSFDRTAEPLRFALEHANELGYPAGREALIAELLETGSATVPLRRAQLRWEMVLGDFTAPGSVRSPEPDAIFFDPYSPSANPEMWTLETFASLRAGLAGDRPCLLTSYTRSTAVRVTMLLAGFFVGIGPSTGEKDETTVATNDPALLDRPLTRSWVEGKVRASTNGAVLRKGCNPRGQITESDLESLRAHAQFQK